MASLVATLRSSFCCFLHFQMKLLFFTYLISFISGIFVSKIFVLVCCTIEFSDLAECSADFFNDMLFALLFSL